MNGITFDDAVLVDTDVASFIFKRDTREALYKPHIEGKIAVIAAQTFAELEAWPLNNSWSSKRRDQLRRYIDESFIFIEANKDVCLMWAELTVEEKRHGRVMAVGDAWIAATALAYSIPLVTHNYKDFKNVSGLTVITGSDESKK